MRAIPKDFAPGRILVVQLRQIGDVLLTTPALRALKKRFPGARISYLAEPLPAKVLEGNPNIDEVIVRNPREGGLEPLKTIRRARAGRFDLVVDFLANPRTALIAWLSGAKVTISYAGNRRSIFYTHAVAAEGVFSGEQKLSLLRVLGAGPESMELDMAVPERAKQRIAAWWDEKGLAGTARPVVCLEPFQKWEALTYPAKSFVKVCELMRRKWGATVIVCWGPGREEDAKNIVESARPDLVLAPPTDLFELAALYRRADLWVGVDGGPRHIAAAQGLPTFAVLGPSDDAWTPPGPRHISVYRRDLACRPCNKRSCKSRIECMTEFKPEEVFERLEQFWERVRPVKNPTTDEHG
ncbi:MAG TPA: glycosyltransferase family 9 protein [bacterium]|nr:glycosyltransferase family 9 protein [bacterium]